MTGMTPAQVAAQDQADAKDRTFERRAITALLTFLWLMFALGIYAALALGGHVPPMPWSPLGQQVEQEHTPPPPPVVRDNSNSVNI